MAAGVRTFMESYQEISGIPIVSSKEYLKDMLRYELGFKGFLVTDYGEINGLHGNGVRVIWLGRLGWLGWVDLMGGLVGWFVCMRGQRGTHAFCVVV